MYGLHKTPDQESLRLKPARVIKWYREIMGLDPSTPLPADLRYKEILAVVLDQDAGEDQTI